jgi:hypothetical protein
MSGRGMEQKKTYNNNKNICTGEVEPNHADVREDENALVIAACLPKVGNNLSASPSRHRSVQLECMNTEKTEYLQENHKELYKLKVNLHTSWIAWFEDGKAE